MAELEIPNSRNTFGSNKVQLVNGSYSLASTSGSYDTTISKDPLTGIEQRAIDSKDALLALQMSSGVLGSALEHKAQWLAADVDGNGLIQPKTHG